MREPTGVTLFPSQDGAAERVPEAVVPPGLSRQPGGPRESRAGLREEDGGTAQGPGGYCLFGRSGVGSQLLRCCKQGPGPRAGVDLGSSAYLRKMGNGRAGRLSQTTALETGRWRAAALRKLKVTGPPYSSLGG